MAARHGKRLCEGPKLSEHPLVGALREFEACQKLCFRERNYTRLPDVASKYIPMCTNGDRASQLHHAKGDTGLHGAEFVVIREEAGRSMDGRAKNLPKMIRRQIQTEGHCAG